MPEGQPTVFETASRFPVPELDQLPADIRDRILATHERAGFVPNVMVVLAYRPAEFRAFFAYHDALMDKEEGLTRAERELIVVATSAANRCPYCVIAHGALVRIFAKAPLLADYIAANWRSAPIGAREQAMLAFAEKLAMSPWVIEDRDMVRLEEQGFSTEEIWDIGAITSFFALSNRMAALTGMMPNPEFHLMGRVPRTPKPDA